MVNLFLQAAETRGTDPILELSEGLVNELDMNERVLPNEIDCQRYEHLADINIPEVEFKRVSIVIGKDVRRAHIVREVRVPDSDECGLYATRTALGWTVAGNVKVNRTWKKELSVNFLDTNNQTLNRQVERFWEIETSGLKEPERTKAVSEEDCRAEDILQRSTKLADGHYETELLWKNDSPQSPNNRTVAEKRLRKKLINSPELESKYRKAMEKYIKEDSQGS